MFNASHFLRIFFELMNTPIMMFLTSILLYLDAFEFLSLVEVSITRILGWPLIILHLSSVYYSTTEILHQ